jgi:hypothetical protein
VWRLRSIDQARWTGTIDHDASAFRASRLTGHRYRPQFQASVVGPLRPARCHEPDLSAHSDQTTTRVLAVQGLRDR